MIDLIPAAIVRTKQDQAWHGNARDPDHPITLLFIHSLILAGRGPRTDGKAFALC